MPKQSKPMTKRIPALLARTHFGQILDRAGGNRERFVVTKKGQAKVIILGVEDYLRTVVEPSPELVALQEEAARSGKDIALEDIQAEIDAWRNENAFKPS